MGANGTGIFDDAMSCELLNEAMDIDAQLFMKVALEVASCEEYMEQDICHGVLVSGAIMDTLMNGTPYEYKAEGVNDWLSRQDLTRIAPYKDTLLQMLDKVISDKSELHDHWAEDLEGYPAWKANVEKMINNITANKEAASRPVSPDAWSHFSGGITNKA